MNHSFRTSVLFAVSALLLALSAHPSWAFLSWIAWSPLIFVFYEVSFFGFLAGSLICGFAFMASFASPLRLYSWSVYIITVVSCLPFFLIIAFATRVFMKRTVSFWLSLLIAPLIVTSAHWILEHFPLGVFFSYFAQGFPLPLLQLAAWSGSSIFVFIIIFSNSFLAMAFRFSVRRTFLPILLFVVFLITAHVYGQHLLSQPQTAAIQVALIQHNLPMSGLWREDHRELIFQKMMELAVQAKKSNPEWLIFPQYALPEDVFRKPDVIRKISKEVNLPILLAMFTPVNEGDVLESKRYDMALYFNEEGHITSTYRAVAAPPLRDIGQVLGYDEKPVETRWGKVGMLLCFEDTQDWLTRKWVRQGAGLLVSLANPGHFTGSAFQGAFLRQDQLRAIETHRFLIRCTPNGHSAIIDPNGKILTTSQEGQEQILVGQVGWKTERTLFTQWGNWLGLTSLVLIVFLTITTFFPSLLRSLSHQK